MKNENLKELKILPYVSNFVLLLLFITVVCTILVPFISYDVVTKEFFITSFFSRIIFFMILLYIYFQLRVLIKNKMDKQKILKQIITTFRIVGLILVVWDISIIIVWIIINVRDSSRLVLYLSNIPLIRSIIGLLLITFAEMLLIALRLKQENDLTV
jgi:hypothetical protein